ncbi:hypothetical protein LZ023_13865 [Pseudomonas silvicola]|nr:hypothetical protein LZ023_13865 [Pseudomonas silvicola]
MDSIPHRPAPLRWPFHVCALVLLLLASAGAGLGVFVGSLFVGSMLTVPMYYDPPGAARLTLFILGAVVGVTTLWWVYWHRVRRGRLPDNRRRMLAGLGCGMATGLFLLLGAETWTVRIAVVLVMVGAVWLARGAHGLRTKT